MKYDDDDNDDDDIAFIQYSKAIQLIFREGHYAMRKYVTANGLYT
jgi:hypothetical protein